jgi:hypothetical protein
MAREDSAENGRRDARPADHINQAHCPARYPATTNPQRTKDYQRTAPMIDYQDFKVLHRHGTEWVEGRPIDPHDLAARDPERLWAKHGQLFECETCGGIVSLDSAEGEGDPGSRSSRP